MAECLGEGPPPREAGATLLTPSFSPSEVFHLAASFFFWLFSFFSSCEAALSCSAFQLFSIFSSVYLEIPDLKV